MKTLELYIHIPFCVKKCDYCDFLSFPADDHTQVEYVHALLREIEFYAPKMKEYLVTTIYLGGGTPSWLDESLIARIMEGVYTNFRVAEQAEISIECNPGTVTASKLRTYRQVGINRLSIGLQSADNRELKLLGRIHTYEQFLKTYELARNEGFYNINVDLISGLPYQKAEDFSATLQQIIGLKPEHISAYTLIIEKGTPFYETYKFDAVRQEAGLKTEVLPSEDEAYRIYKLTQIVLRKAGYEQYEISNYARPGFQCLHNDGYWTRENYLGLGLGAASLVDEIRYSNTRDLYEYLEISKKLTWLAPDNFDTSCSVLQNWIGTNGQVSAEVLTKEARMEEFMFLGLRRTEGVYRTAFETNFGLPIEAVYREVLDELKQQKLLYAAEGRIALTDKGFDLANYCMAKFLL